MRIVLWFPFVDSITKNNLDEKEYSVIRSVLPFIKYLYDSVGDVYFYDKEYYAPAEYSDLWLLEQEVGPIKTTNNLYNTDVLMPFLCNFRAKPQLFHSRIKKLEDMSLQCYKIVYYEADEEIGSCDQELEKIFSHSKNCNLLSYLLENKNSSINNKLDFVITISSEKTKQAIENNLHVPAVSLPNLFFDSRYLSLLPIKHCDKIYDLAIINHYNMWFSEFFESNCFNKFKYLCLGRENVDFKYQFFDYNIFNIKEAEFQNKLMKKISSAKVITPCGRPHTSRIRDWTTSKLFEANRAGCLCPIFEGFELKNDLNNQLTIDLTYNNTDDMYRILTHVNNMCENEYVYNTLQLRRNVLKTLSLKNDQMTKRLELIKERMFQ